jgi:ribosomal-protein-serine acetyltransferase
MNLRLEIDPETALIPLTLERAPEFMSLIDQSRASLREWLGWLDSTRNVAELRIFLEACLKEYGEAKDLALWIEHRGAIAGIIHLREVSPANKKAVIGYWVGAPYRGRGFARKATRAISTYAFRVRGLNRLEIRCATGNTASQAVPTALGYHQEGVLRQNEWLYDHFVDHVVFGMLASEWTE